MMTAEVRSSNDRPTLRTTARYALLAGLCLTLGAVGCKEEPTAPATTTTTETNESKPSVGAVAAPPQGPVETAPTAGAQSEEDPMGGMTTAERLAAARRGEIPMERAEPISPEQRVPVAQERTTKVATVAASLTLDDAGAEPRVELRYETPVGLDERYEVTESTARVVMSVGGEPVIRQTPQINMRGRLNTGEPSDGGRTMSFQLYDVLPEPGGDLPETVVNLTLRQFEPMLGIQGDLVLDDRNQHIGEATLSGGEDSSDGNRLMAASFTPMAIADLILPEEAVGVGASWTVSSTALMRRAQVKRTLTYTVLAMDGSTVRLGVEGSFEAEAQDLPRNANQVTIQKLRLTEYSGTLKGEVTIDLDGVMPREGLIENEYVMRVEVTANGEMQRAGEQGTTTTIFSSEAR